MRQDYFFVLAAGILSGGIVFGGKVLSGMGLSLYEISVLPELFIFLFLPLLVFKKELRPKKELLGTYIVFGFIAALIGILNYAPVVLGVPVAVAVLLLYTQPLWTVFFGRLFLGEKINKKKLFSLALVLIGVLILVNPFRFGGVENPVGVSLALLGGVALSAWVIFSRVCGRKGCSPITTRFSFTFFALIFFAAAYPLLAFLTEEPSIISFSLDFPLEIWFAVFLFAVFARISGNLCFLKGSQTVPASEGGIILLIEPLVGALLASVFLGEPFTPNIVLGGIFILAANYLVIKK